MRLETVRRAYRIDPPKLSMAGEGRAGNSFAVEGSTDCAGIPLIGGLVGGAVWMHHLPVPMSDLQRRGSGEIARFEAT